MLNSILVPVDFSNEAGTALKFAAEISKRASANLTFFHVLQGNENEAEAKQRLAQLEAELIQSFGTDLKCNSLVVQGDFLAGLESQTESQKPDLIVMGTKGASGLKKIFIGSNTVKVISHTKVPVLVIPETARFEEFNRTGKNRVVFATDLEEVGDEAIFDMLAEVLSLMIEPKLRVLNVRPRNTNLSFHQTMERAALVSRFKEEIETERITVFNSKVLDGINFYLDKHSDTGLIAMIARDSGGLFQHNFTQEMASITRYPLLVLSDSEGWEIGRKGWKQEKLGICQAFLVAVEEDGNYTDYLVTFSVHSMLSGKSTFVAPVLDQPTELNWTQVIEQGNTYRFLSSQKSQPFQLLLQSQFIV